MIMIAKHSSGEGVELIMRDGMMMKNMDDHHVGFKLTWEMGGMVIVNINDWNNPINVRIPSFQLVIKIERDQLFFHWEKPKTRISILHYVLYVWRVVHLHSQYGLSRIFKGDGEKKPFLIL